MFGFNKKDDGGMAGIEMLLKMLAKMGFDPLQMVDKMTPQAWQKIAEMEAEAGAPLFANITPYKEEKVFMLGIYKDLPEGGEIWKSFPFQTLSELIKFFITDDTATPTLEIESAPGPFQLPEPAAAE